MAVKMGPCDIICWQVPQKGSMVCKCSEKQGQAPFLQPGGEQRQGPQNMRGCRGAVSLGANIMDSEDISLGCLKYNKVIEFLFFLAS